MEGATSALASALLRTGTNAAGVTYAQTDKTDGAGDVALADSFAEIGDDEWFTLVVNPYDTKLSDFEQFNGRAGRT